MADAFGYNASIGWAEEVTWGTPVARALFMEVMSESMSKAPDFKEAASTRALSERRRYEGMSAVGGALEFEMLYEGVDEFLKHLFGGVASAVDDATAFKHTYTLADALPPGLSIEVYRGDDFGGTEEAFLYEGCKINAATFTFEPDEPLKVSYEIVAQDESIVALTTVTYPDLSGALLVKGNELSCELGDVATTIDGGELTINNGLLTDKKIMGTKLIDEPVRSSRRQVTGSITADWVDKTLYNKMINSTEQKIEFILTSPTNIAGSGTPYSMAFTLPVCRFEGETPAVSDPGIIKQVLPFFALSTGTGTSDSVYAEVVNALTSI